MIDLATTDSGFTFYLDKSIYNVDAIYKCMYWYSGNFDILVDDYSEFRFRIGLTKKQNVKEPLDYQELETQLRQDLIDFKLRDVVTKETKVIRELIVAKAFSNYIEESPVTSVSDPVGFNPGEF